MNSWQEKPNRATPLGVEMCSIIALGLASHPGSHLLARLTLVCQCVLEIQRVYMFQCASTEKILQDLES